jgi:rhamnose utilization protein RhaD (predicted bifunctional aldolase and dehydrogenase)
VKNITQPRLLPGRHVREIACLRDLSARVGSDPLLVQASNGNTSIKLDGILWIKASGGWLARATQGEMFVPLNLAEVKHSIQNEPEITWPDTRKDGLRPSIETTMHAILQHRVVVHVHSVNTISWAIRLDGPGQLRERLAGLRWRWIPYTSSGIPLAREVEKAVADAPETDVLILANHGLVVCGPDCRTAETLLYEVERRLAIAPRGFSKPDARFLAMRARFSTWKLPDVDSLHALGTDTVTQKILRGGVLYPCQAIFLGQTMPLLSPAAVMSKFIEFPNGGGRTQPFLAVETRGVLVSEKMTSAERATLIGLVQVTLRTDEFARLHYLTSAQLTDLQSKGGHAYKELASMEKKRNSWALPSLPIPRMRAGYAIDQAT